jgi:steroid delta-isomerase-like uncharacterized protein
MSIEEENKAIIRRVINGAFNKGDLSVAEDGVAANYVFHGAIGELRGVEGFKQVVTMMRTAFPDLHVTIEDMVGEGDKVACRFIGRGTFKGELMGISPTGKVIATTEASFIYFEDGKEVEVWSYTDMLDWYRQLGVSPPSQ